MRLPIAKFYPAHSSNYSRGREQPIRYITVHHSAGWEATLRYLWGNPNRNASSHFWVGNVAGQIEQYVDTDDTAWTNSNWKSNNESLTIEVRGDWRGYYDQTTLNNLQNLILELRKRFPNVGLTYHKDVSSTYTLCPADLKDKGWAQNIWNNVTRILTTPPPKPTPPPAQITYQAIPPKRIELIRTANLWNFNFTAWANAKAVQPYGQGSVIDVVAIATNALGAKYYMTAYSYNGGAVRATNGFNIADCKDYVPPAPVEPPKVEPKWESMQTPRTMRLVYANYVIDLDTKKPVGSEIPAETDVALVEKITTLDNKVYVRSKWSKDNNKNWGIPLDQFKEVPEAPDVPVEPTPEPPIDIDPTVPGNGDAILENTNTIIKILKAIANFFGIKWE